MMEEDWVHYMDLCATPRKEKDEIEEESMWLKTVVKEVMTVILEVELEEDQHLEVGLQKITIVIKELRVKIVDLEAWVVHTTPPEL